jgi:hypothetical protein
MAVAGFHSIAKANTLIFKPAMADRVIYSADGISTTKMVILLIAKSQESKFYGGMPKV